MHQVNASLPPLLTDLISVQVLLAPVSNWGCNAHPGLSSIQLQFACSLLMDAAICAQSIHWGFIDSLLAC